MLVCGVCVWVSKSSFYTSCYWACGSMKALRCFSHKRLTAHFSFILSLRNWFLWNKPQSVLHLYFYNTLQPFLNGFVASCFSAILFVLICWFHFWGSSWLTFHFFSLSVLITPLPASTPAPLAFLHSRLIPLQDLCPRSSPTWNSLPRISLSLIIFYYLLHCVCFLQFICQCMTLYYIFICLSSGFSSV